MDARAYPTQVDPGFVAVGIVLTAVSVLFLFLKGQKPQ